MKNSFLLLCTALILSDAQAQCEKDAFINKEYGWKKATDALLSSMGTNAVKAKAQVQQTAAFMQQLNPKPRGGEGSWYGYYDGIAPEKQYAKHYNANLTIYPYRCVNNKETRGIGYTASAFICFNGLSDAGSWIQLNEKRVLAVRAFKKDNDGYLYFNFSNAIDADMHEAWMFTKNDQLPFVYMTRRDYLNEMKDDANRKLAKSDPPLKPYYQKCLDLIDGEMKKGDAYLSETAEVLPFETDFQGFPTGKKSADPNRSYIVKGLNDAYFNKSLPPSAPQYVVMITRYIKQDIVSSGFHTAFISSPWMKYLSALPAK